MLCFFKQFRKYLWFVVVHSASIAAEQWVCSLHPICSLLALTFSSDFVVLLIRDLTTLQFFKACDFSHYSPTHFIFLSAFEDASFLVI